MRKLPVSQTISHMMSSTFNNLAFALRAQWPWFVVMTAVIAGLGSFFGWEMLADEAKVRRFFEANPDQVGLFLISVFGGVLLLSLAFSSIAVNWHRYVLLDEVPQNLGEKLRLDATVWRYFGNIILISLMAILAMLPLSFIMVLMGSQSPMVVGLVVLVYVMLIVLPTIYRLSIKLPAIAIGRQNFRMGDAWNASRGNWWQIVGISIGFSIISWGVGLAVVGLSTLLNTLLGPDIGFGIDMIIQAAINWIFTVMGITMLTSLYGYFVEQRDF